MASQGPLYAGTVADDATIGTTPWSNPTNAQGAADGVFATASFLSNVVTDIRDNSIKIVQGGTIGGTDQSAGALWSLTLAYVSFGSSSNLWGLTWQPADINLSTFGVAMACQFTKGVPRITHYLKATNFGFTIPAGATINGILVEQDRKYDSVSFVAGTLISAPYGEIPIEELENGMEVYAWDKNGRKKVVKILALRKGFKKTVILSTKSSQVEATIDHPFWTRKRGWQKAEKLTVWDEVSVYGKWERLQKIELTGKIKDVYNLSLESPHTYMANGFGVHNLITSSPTTWKAYVDAIRITVTYTPSPTTGNFFRLF